MAGLLRTRASTLAGSTIRQGPAAAGGLIQQAKAGAPLSQASRFSNFAGPIQRPPATGGLLQPTPAAAALLKAKNLSGFRGMLAPYHPRLLSTDSQYVEIEKKKFEQIQKMIEELKELDEMENKMKGSFYVLASSRGHLPLTLGAWDNFVYAAKLYFVPDNLEGLRTLIYSSIWNGFLGAVGFSLICNLSRSEIKAAVTKYVQTAYPWLAIIFNLKAEGEKGEKDEEEEED